jgi:SHS2 domain-containing protein
MRCALPQPFEDLGHTADVGMRVRGASAEEALARLTVALGGLLSGGGEVPIEREETVRVTGGPGLAGTAVALLRELLFRFATERLLPAAAEITALSAEAVEARIAFGRYDPERHAEGVDVKAVTWHLARLEREGDGFVAQAVLDI